MTLSTIARRPRAGPPIRRAAYERRWPESQLNARFLLVRRPHPAQSVQHGGEEVEEGLQSIEILDDLYDLEVQLVHVLGEPGTEPTLAVLHLQPDLGLIPDHPPELRVGEQLSHPALVIRLDDECLVELGIG